jgi:hypothetical protein
VNVGPDALLAAPVAAVFAGAGDLRGVVVEITEQVAVTCYRVAGQCAAVHGGGEGPRGEARQGPSRALASRGVPFGDAAHAGKWGGLPADAGVSLGC